MEFHPHRPLPQGRRSGLVGPQPARDARALVLVGGGGASGPGRARVDRAGFAARSDPPAPPCAPHPQRRSAVVVVVQRRRCRRARRDRAGLHQQQARVQAQPSARGAHDRRLVLSPRLGPRAALVLPVPLPLHHPAQLPPVDQLRLRPSAQQVDQRTAAERPRPPRRQPRLPRSAHPAKGPHLPLAHARVGRQGARDDPW